MAHRQQREDLRAITRWLAGHEPQKKAAESRADSTFGRKSRNHRRRQVAAAVAKWQRTHRRKHAANQRMYRQRKKAAALAAVSVGG